MSAIAVTFGESSWLRLVPLTVPDMNTKVITAVGTKLDFTSAIKVAPTHAGAAAATKAKWFTTQLANGNNFAIPDNSVSVNPITGAEVDTQGSAATTGSHSCSVTYSPTDRTTLIGLFESGKPAISIREIGKNATTGVCAGYELVLGQLTNLKENPQKGPSNMDFDITGVVVGSGGSFSIKETTPGTPDVDETDFNAVATGSGNTITPLKDGAARTIIALTSGDWTNLLLGQTVTKLVA